MDPQNLSPMNPNSLKARFTTIFLKSLRKIHSSSSSPSQREIFHRYRTVKIAADVSIARAAGPARAWSRALLRRRKGLAKRIKIHALSRRNHGKKKPRYDRLVDGDDRSCWSKSKIDFRQSLKNPFDDCEFQMAAADPRKQPVNPRNYGMRNVRDKNSSLRKKRDKEREFRVSGDVEDELRKLVPGGEDMDLCTLLGETAHYLKCLNTQVEVMRNIVNLYRK